MAVPVFGADWLAEELGRDVAAIGRRLARVKDLVQGSSGGMADAFFGHAGKSAPSSDLTQNPGLHPSQPPCVAAA